jgi:hypothetical protein
MSYVKSGLAAATLIASLGLGSAALAGQAAYKVTITNITHDQTFTPILAASHKRGVKLFKLGNPAGARLEALAEGGDIVPLEDYLDTNPKVGDITDSGGPLGPGNSVTLYLDTKAQYRSISLAAMLIPTNDAFVALNGVRGPKGKKSNIFYALAYDAGTENNSEDCDDIPGPMGVCGGDGFVLGGGEGFVHIHPGIHGVGDLDEADYDWRNPVARIKITRVPSP